MVLQTLPDKTVGTYMNGLAGDPSIQLLSYSQTLMIIAGQPLMKTGENMM